MIRKEQLYEQILEQIDLTKETDDEELQELIRTVLDEAADEEYIPLSDKSESGVSYSTLFVNWMFCRSFLKMIRLQRLW